LPSLPMVADANKKPEVLKLNWVKTRNNRSGTKKIKNRYHHRFTFKR